MLKFQVFQFLQGIRDSLSFKRISVYLIASKSLLNYFLGCMFVGFSFFLLTLFFERIMAFTSPFLPTSLNLILTLAVNLILLLIYVFAALVTSIWFNDIAAAAIEIEKNFLHNETFGKRVKLPLTSSIMYEIYRGLLVVFLSLQGFLFSSLLPQIGQFIGYIHVAFLYSFYCFEYKWGTNSYFEKSLAFFEDNAFYFVGYGFVFAIAVSFFPFIYGLCVFLTLFPIFLLSALPHSPPIIEAKTWSEGFQKLLKNSNQRMLISNFKFSRSEKRFGIFSWAKYNISLVNSLGTLVMKSYQKKS